MCRSNVHSSVITFFRGLLLTWTCFQIKISHLHTVSSKLFSHVLTILARSNEPARECCCLDPQAQARPCLQKLLLPRYCMCVCIMYVHGTCAYRHKTCSLRHTRLGGTRHSINVHYRRIKVYFESRFRFLRIEVYFDARATHHDLPQCVPDNRLLVGSYCMNACICTGM